MSDMVKKQILSVRDTALTNMLDFKAVQKIAFDMDHHELVCYIEENHKEYMQFIFTGKA